MFRSRVWSIWLVSVIACAMAAFGSTSASAHTEVQRSTPSPGEAVDGEVDRVELVFLDPVQPEVEISVTGPDGQPVAGLETTRLDEDRRIAGVRFDPLTVAGTYEVNYEFIALDGAAQRGSYTFRNTAASVGLDDPGDAGGAGTLGIVAFLVLAVAAGVAARFRSSR